MTRDFTTSLIILTCVAFLGLSSAAVAEQSVVHVAVRADSEHPGMEAFRLMDGNPGTIGSPLATLEGARDAIRSGSYPNGVIVNLREGSYRLTSSFSLTSRRNPTESSSGSPRYLRCAFRAARRK